MTIYREYRKYTEEITLPPGKRIGSRVTWRCHNPAPGDIIEVMTSADRVIWVSVPVNGGPAPGLRDRDCRIWARATVRRLATFDEPPVMDLNVSIAFDCAEEVTG